MAEIIEMKNIVEAAKEKINKELAENKNQDRYVKAVISHVAETIKGLLQQSEKFAEIVLKTKRTLSDCCAEIMKGCGSYISDLDVYKKAAQFYFPNCSLSCIMEIELIGEAPDSNYLNKEAPKPKEKPAKTVNSKPDKKTALKKSEQKKETIQFSLF